MRTKLWLGLITLTLIMSACTNTSAPIDEIALFDDTALDQAISIDASSLNISTATVAQTLDIPTAAELAALASQAEAKPKSAISYPDSSIATPVNTDGFVVYVQERNKKYSIRRATVTGRGASGNKLIYKGKYAIESAATSVDGAYISFVAQTRAGNSDVFFLDYEGKLLGKRRGLYRITKTAGDESDISMSLDGLTLAWEGDSEETEQRNYTVAVIDAASAGISLQAFDIVLGGAFELDIYDPSLSGDGRTVVFAESEVATSVFGAPMIVSFSTVGEGGAIEYVGDAGLTTAIEDPSTSFAANRLLFKETYDGVDYAVYIDSELAQLYVLLGGAPITHPHLTADGAFYTFAFNGSVYLSEVKTDDPVSAAIDILKTSAGINSVPYWAKKLPPPPPLPEGTIQYSGSTAGGPLWTRPEGTGPDLQDNGPVAYDAYSFSSSTEGFYEFLSLQDYDGYLHLYQAPFDPTTPLTNVLAGNDDLPGGGRRSGFKVFLTANTNYVLVTSAFEAGQTGSFTNTIIPPQPAEPGQAPTIELFSGDLSVAATNQSISYEWFVTSFEALSCSIDYGDGTVETIVGCTADTIQSASHSYSSEGFYTVTFTATNSNGSTLAKTFPTVANDDPNAFNIVVVFANDLLSPGQRAAFQDAAARWGEVISSDLSSTQSGTGIVPSDYSCFGEAAFNGFVDDLVISASGQVIDGAGNILASAGPCLFRPDGSNGSLAPLSVYGIMQFDVADLDNLEQDGGLFSTILHEMGHVLGIGTLWDDNGFLVDGEADGADPTDPNYDPKYIGAEAVNAYSTLSASSQSTVPAANTGGAGTREGHWREATFDNELMTGFLNNASEPLSILTVGGLEDLGYDVNYSAADPFTLPASTALSTTSLSGFSDIVLDNIGQNKR